MKIRYPLSGVNGELVTTRDCRHAGSWPSTLFETLSLLERHVADFAKAGAVVVQRADMAPVHLIGTVAEVFGAVRDQPCQQRVDFGLDGDEGIQRGVVGLGHDRPRVGFGGITALLCALVKFSRTRNVPRTSGSFRVAWVLHGGIGGIRKGLEYLGNVLHGVATQIAPRGAPCFGLSL